MFDKLIEWIQQWLALFKCWKIVRPYNTGLCYTLGKFRRDNAMLQPGFHLIWPFNIEEVESYIMTAQSFNVAIQSVTLKDHTQVTIDLEAVARTTDPQLQVLHVYNDGSTFDTIIPGIAQQIAVEYTLDELLNMRALAAKDGRHTSFEKKILLDVNKFLTDRQWGLVVDEIFISEFMVNSLKNGILRVVQ